MAYVAQPGGDVPTPTSAAGYSSVGFNNSWLDAISAQAALNNQFNLDQVNMVNAFNAKEAQKNRDFQERMSNTAYQRAVADLKKAGINPVLAAQSAQGASTPNGYAASGQKASADTTLSSGLMSMMSSLINAQSAQAVANIYAEATKYSANLRDPFTQLFFDEHGNVSMEKIANIITGVTNALYNGSAYDNGGSGKGSGSAKQTSKQSIDWKKFNQVFNNNLGITLPH